jgi:hypothetical protein
MTSSWKAVTLFGVSIGTFVGAGAAAEVVIVGTDGTGSGGRGCDEEGEPYSASPVIAGFE